MTYTAYERELAGKILDRVRELGADAAGFAPVELLRSGPSERLFPNMKDRSRDHFAEQITTGLPHGAVLFEEGAKTALIYAVAHPAEKPEMDYWYGEINPPGNRILLDISRKLKAYLKETAPEVRMWPKRYHVERGGLYLKDAAVAAGLGVIGRNNLLLHPTLGPRLRLRAVLLDIALPPTGPVDFDPCGTCPGYCRKSCPQNAFAEQVYTEAETGIGRLPGRDGSYFRAACNRQMVLDEETAETVLLPEYGTGPEKLIKYCRACELACPVGRE